MITILKSLDETIRKLFYIQFQFTFEQIYIYTHELIEKAETAAIQVWPTKKK